MTIAAGHPEPPRGRPARRPRPAPCSVCGGIALGAIMLARPGSAATPIMLGTSLILISLVPILRRTGLPERVAFTSCGLILVTVLMLPWSAWESRCSVRCR